MKEEDPKQRKAGAATPANQDAFIHTKSICTIPQNGGDENPPFNLVIKTPRQYRVIKALMQSRPTREQLDRIAGASNSPQVILELRRLNWAIQTHREEVKDRDGKTVRRGRFELNPEQYPLSQVALEKWEGKQ